MTPSSTSNRWPIASLPTSRTIASVQRRSQRARSYPTAGNWKLAVENFRECYHCAPAHPGYTSVNAYVIDGERDRQARTETVAAWAATWEGTRVRHAQHGDLGGQHR